MNSHTKSKHNEDEDDTSINLEAELSEETEEEPQTPMRSKKSSARRVVMNVALTKYAVVKKAARHFKWQLIKKEEDDNWDVFWTDAAVQAEKFSKMKPYQKINHFPGMYMLARKNYLAKNLNRLRKIYPAEFNFFPKTWLIPAEYSELVMQFNGKKHKKVFIVKPEASCQGRGIFLTKKIDDFSLDDRYVVQEYLSRPFLIDNLKFDLRIYVLIAGCDPLRIYLHKEGLARFATEPYIKPNSSNLSKQCMHLTNYAINKNNGDFIFNEDSKVDNIGHKRSLTSTLKQIEEMGHDTHKLWEKIKDIIIKTLCSVQPSLAHTYKACQPDDPYNGMCFEILGLDIILDHKLKPWLLEVNHSPSFTTDSPLDSKIKFEVISEAFTLLNINADNRTNYHSKQKREVLERSVSKSIAKTKEQKINEMNKAQEKRERWEKEHLGGYSKIFENSNIEKYQKYIETAGELWEEWTGGKARSKKVEVTEKFDKAEKKVVPLKGVSETPVFIQTKSSIACQPKTSHSQIVKRESRERETSCKGLSVFDRLSQQPCRKPSPIDYNMFPCVKFEDPNAFIPILPPFMDYSMSSANKNEKFAQRNTRFMGSEEKSTRMCNKKNTRFSDFPLFVQFVLGGDKTSNKNNKNSLKIRNLTPGYKKKPYQYGTNLSFFKQWDVND